MMSTRREESVTAQQVAEEPLTEDRPRLPYQPPRLVTWGTLTTLTQGPLNGTEDGFFSGTRGA